MSVEKRTRAGRTRYVARWRQDGRQLARTFDRRRDAEAFERERRREAALGAHGLPGPSPMALGDWLRRWWGTEAARWAPSTRRSYAESLDRWVLPYASGVRLRDLGHTRVREWRASILAAGCPPTQANKASRVLSAALGVAVTEGLLPANPAAPLRSLPVADRRPRVLVPAELEAIRAHMPTLRDVVMLGLIAYAGLRPGEALALRWGDVGRVLVIDRAVSDGKLRSATKTYQRRTVEIVSPLAEDLELHRPKVPDPDALIVAGRDGQVLDLSHWRARVLAPAARAAGVKMTPYDGRHSCASLLIHEGRSLAYVAAFLGHASVTTTARYYTHLIEESRLGIAASMVDAIRTARNDLERRDVYPPCTRRPVRTLRSPAQAAGSRLGSAV